MVGEQAHMQPTTWLQTADKAYLSGMLISSSTVMGRLTWPLMENSLVPVLLGRPRLEYHCWIGAVEVVVGAHASAPRKPTRYYAGLQSTCLAPQAAAQHASQPDASGACAHSTPTRIQTQTNPGTQVSSQSAPHLRPPPQDVGDGGKRLHIVDGGGAAPEPLVGRIGRLQPRPPLLALQALQQRSLLACTGRECA